MLGEKKSDEGLTVEGLGDKLAESFFCAYNLPVTTVRPFNTYGPRMRLKDGRAIPAFLAQALTGEPLTVFGNGKQTRSLCYIDDMVNGIEKLLMSSLITSYRAG